MGTIDLILLALAPVAFAAGWIIGGGRAAVKAKAAAAASGASAAVQSAVSKL